MRVLLRGMFCLFLVLLSVSCSPDIDDVKELSITVSISNGSSAKSAIVPVYGENDSEANVDVTHYRIYLYSSDTDTVDTEGDAIHASGYLSSKNPSFSVSGIVSGLYWAVKAEAYVSLSGEEDDIDIPDDGSLPDDLVKVAEVSSQSQLIAGAGDNFISMSFTELGKGEGYTGGGLNITLILPPGLEGSQWNYDLSLGETLDENILNDSDRTGTVSSGALYGSENRDGIDYATYDISLNNLSINQGIYFLTVNVSNSNTTNPSIIRTAVVPVRIIPGTISKGDIDLSYEIEINEAPLEITDETGKIVELENVKFVFTYRDVGNRILTLSTENYIDTSDFGDNVNAIYIIDGELITDPSSTTQLPGSPNKRFNCRFEDPEIDAMKGNHIITLIIYNEDNPLIFGSFTDFAEWYPDDQEITVEEVTP